MVLVGTTRSVYWLLLHILFKELMHALCIYHTASMLSVLADIAIYMLFFTSQL